MSGSLSPSKPTDQQCEHCGLYFTPQGIANHEKHCDLKDVDARAQELEESPADLEDVGDDDRDGADDGSSSNPAFQGPEASPTSTATDGAGDAGDLEDDVDDAPETYDCPSCGEDTGATDEDLEEGTTYRCSDCRETFRYTGGA